MTRRWKWSKWCLEKFQNKIPSYYLERKSMLDKVEYSLLRLSDQNFANELFIRIKEKESTFEEVAKQYSEGPERDTFGRVGPTPLGRAHPDIAKLLEASIKGQIWSPRKIESWWIILQLNNIQNVPLDEKLSIDLALELGLKYVEKIIIEDLN